PTRPPSSPTRRSSDLQTVRHVGHSRAAVAVQIRAEKSQLAELWHKMLRENAFAVVFFNDRDDFVLDKLPRRLPHQPLFVVQLRIKIDVIDTAISSHSSLLVSGGRKAAGARRRAWRAILCSHSVVSSQGNDLLRAPFRRMPFARPRL